MFAELLIAASLLLGIPTRSGPPRQVYERPELRAIDGGRQDRNPLETSLFVPSYDLSGAPIGFQRVYRVDGLEGRVVRASGGLYAISPYGTYAKTKRGEVPTIAPSTVFAIGMPLEWCLRTSKAQRENESRVDSRRYGRVDAVQADAALLATGRGRTEERPLSVGSGMPAIIIDESYRRHFYRSLIRDSL